MYERLTTDISKAPGARSAHAADRGASPGAALLRGLLGTFATHDAILLGYLGVVITLLLRSEPSAEQAESVRRNLACAMALVLCCVFARCATSVSPAIRSTIYRVALVGQVLLNYLLLRAILPVVRPDSLDAQLLQLDLTLFGVEPALWLERFNTRPVVEWFSFFYYSYFFICGGYMLLALFLRKPGRHTTEYAVGTAMVYCIGQLGYMAVPGHGPIVALRHLFHGPIDGGFFWGLVHNVVQAGGAMKDIFPSLHTAGPLWFALYAFHCAKTDRRFLWLAVVSLFFSVNIIISTMFLRWHYAIDVVAGVTLAVSARWAAPRIARWEESFRARLGETHPWTFK